MMDSPRPYRVVVYSSADDETIIRLCERIRNECPEAAVCGVLHIATIPKNLRQRAANLAANLKDPNFVRYALARSASIFTSAANRATSALLRKAHGAPPAPHQPQTLAEYGAAVGMRVHATTAVHAPDSIGFVRGLGAHLGIAYGTPILKARLFTIPADGTINIHKRKVPDYRGGGPVGLWELLDRQASIGVTVHEMEAKLDTGAVIRSAEIPIDPYDTLVSLALKAAVVGNDLLTAAVRDFATGTVSRTVQQGDSQLFRAPRPHVLAGLERKLRRERKRYVVPTGRPGWKLAARALALGPKAALKARQDRKDGSYPIVVLFHHLISDRPHHLGMPTEAFYRQVLWLRSHYDIVSLAEAQRMLQSGVVKRPTVVLTFDDGYAENFVNLRAVTEQLQVPVTLFICSDNIERHRPFDHDISQGWHGFEPLTWEQVALMRQCGMEFGSHTRTHFDCGSSDADLLSTEILTSRRELENRIGHPVDHFSFPFGRVENISRPAMDMAQGSYGLVASAYGGVNRPDKSRSFRHIRRSPHPSSITELELTLQNILETRVIGGWIEAQGDGTDTTNR